MYFASPPISNGAVRSIRLSNPQIRRLCFYPSLRTTRKISRHKSVPLPTRTTDTKYKWRAKGWFAMFCRGWFDYNEWSGNAMGRRMTCPPSPVNNWAGLAALRDISALSCDSILAII